MMLQAFWSKDLFTNCPKVLLAVNEHIDNEPFVSSLLCLMGVTMKMIAEGHDSASEQDLKEYLHHLIEYLRDLDRCHVYLAGNLLLEIDQFDIVQLLNRVSSHLSNNLFAHSKFIL